MKIAFGCTRIVFIFSNTVIKIPRIRLVYPIRRYFEHNRKNKVGVELKKFGSNPITAIVRYFLSGFYANRLEYIYSKNNSSDGIVPVRSFCYGLISIQQRGEVVFESDIQWKRIARAIKKRGVAENDTLRSCNFCIIQKRIRILDYGCKETIIALDQINLKIIERLGIL